MSASYSSAGTVAYGLSSAGVVAAHPAGAFNDAVVFIVAQKETTGSGPITASSSDLTKLGEKLTSVGTAGGDTGPTRIAAFYRILDGNETTTSYTFTGSSDAMWAQGILVTKTVAIALGAVWAIDAVVGEDVTSGAAWSATMPAISMGANDLLLMGLAIPTDVTTPSQFSAQAVTATGMTFTTTEIGEPDTANVNDLGGNVIRATVTAGTIASVAPTLTATVGGTTTNVYGPTILVRLRATEAPVERMATAQMYVNVGLRDITDEVTTRYETALMYTNIAINVANGELVVDGYSFGEDLTGNTTEILWSDSSITATLYADILGPGTYYRAFLADGAYISPVLGTTNIDALIVGGGGGGGCHGSGGGGGGGGGLLWQTGISATYGVPMPIVIGAGGSGSAVVGTDGSPGGITTFAGYTALGGGGGKSGATPVSGNGSGGGGVGGVLLGEDYAGDSGTVGQGYPGGSGRGDPSTSLRTAGGGGGAGGAGVSGWLDTVPSPDDPHGGDGGLGFDATSLIGTAFGETGYFASGGGGGVRYYGVSTPGVGPIGGGGKGSKGTPASNITTPGQVNTGGGGGGGGGQGDTSPRPGREGGSGIVVVRFTIV